MATVMVIDDEPVLLHMIVALIEEDRHRVLSATNGRDALDLLGDEPEPPALIISDVMMPHMDGVALAHALKNDRRWQHVPIVLMSAAVHARQAAAADHFIAKPFELDQLEQLIDRYTREHKHWANRLEWPDPIQRRQRDYWIAVQS